MAKNVHLVVLGLALVLGFWLRWDGLDWGRKSGAQFHPDEPRFVEQANALDNDLPLRKSYVFGFGQAIRSVHKIIPSVDYARIGRGLSLASGMLLCLVVFAIAREMKLGDRAAALAAALTSLNTMCAIHSHFGTADMTYVLQLHLFALCVLRNRFLLAAVVAGLAMATKFGMILLPSLLWLCWNVAAKKEGSKTNSAAGLHAVLMLAIAAFVFVAAQGFTFDRESIRMISLSARQDNMGGFEHQKWQNIITYSGVAIRSLGIPVFIFACIALARVRWRTIWSGGAPVAVIACLPFALHAVGLLAINTSFPRHILPLIPLLLIAAAYAIENLPRFRVPVAALCLAWSALLAWSDGAVFRVDPREQAARAAPRGEAVMVAEARTWRFERSEINPLRAPDERALYHASVDEFLQYRDFLATVARGAWHKVFEAGPPLILPEQFLYDAAWGSFEKFAGKCEVYERAAPLVPIDGKTSP